MLLTFPAYQCLSDKDFEFVFDSSFVVAAGRKIGGHVGEESVWPNW